MPSRTDPELKAEICQKIQEKFHGDVAVKDTHELLNVLSIDPQWASYGKQKRAVGSLIYGTGHLSRYHDKEGQRHFKLLMPFEAGK